jgi:hypothetical protein
LSARPQTHLAFMLLKWIIRMVKDIAQMAVTNRTWGVALFLLFLLGIGLLIVASQAAAPFIYTLF